MTIPRVAENPPRGCAASFSTFCFTWKCLQRPLWLRGRGGVGVGEGSCLAHSPGKPSWTPTGAARVSPQDRCAPMAAAVPGCGQGGDEAESRRLRAEMAASGVPGGDSRDRSRPEVGHRKESWQEGVEWGDPQEEGRVPERVTPDTESSDRCPETRHQTERTRLTQYYTQILPKGRKQTWGFHHL